MHCKFSFKTDGKLKEIVKPVSLLILVLLIAAQIQRDRNYTTIADLKTQDFSSVTSVCKVMLINQESLDV